uniref:Uncharacterized protein n=1 Tax=Ditylenchus dipsaci TaxID=166011 RepID=A0A915D9Y4_9BILA
MYYLHGLKNSDRLSFLYYMEIVNSCETQLCTLIKYKGYPHVLFKTAFSILNFAGCCYFLYVVHAKKFYNIKNIIVKYTVIAELLFNVFPGNASLFSNYMFGINPGTYVGPWLVTLTIADIACCSAIYSHIFLKNAVLPTNNIVSDQTIVVVASEYL